MNRLNLSGAFALAVCLSTVLAAQSPSAPAGAPNFSGIWGRLRCMPNTSDSCPDITPPAAERLLTARAKAFRDMFDELAAPKYDCGPATLPALLTDPYPFQIDQQADRLIFTYEKDDVVRTIWLAGHGHKPPPTNAFFPQGYSVGRFEGNQLIVETTKFSFEPQGLDDDFGSMPSSTRKRMVERYAREGDRLKLDVTVEDPVFLRTPLTLTLESTISKQGLDLPWGCDLEAAQRNLGLIPTKYPQDPPPVPFTNK
jgi:hypothetical protein